MAGAAATQRAPVVVVTGGSSGIGLAVAEHFCSRGASVVLAARGEHTLADAAVQCRWLGGQVMTHAADVADANAMATLALRAVDTFGRIDAWINAAGTSLWGPFEDIPPAQHERLIRTNLLGVIHGSYAALRHMRSRAGRGVIVNVSSIAGRIPTPLAASYTASKFGVAGFSEALRHELRDRGDLAVCAVYPSFVDTPTPQRSANFTGRALRPVPPVLDPARVAAAIAELVEHPRRALRLGVHHLAALPYALAPDATGAAMARAARRYFLASGDPAPDSDGALFEPRALPAAVHGAWGLPQRRRARGWALGLGTAALVAVGLVGALRRGRA